MSKVIVVGGGASGLVSAIFAARNNNEVILLERNSKCGKKLLLTGNGKCNYWNSNINIESYHSETVELVNNIITEENEEKVLSFFEEIGIVPKIKNGYYYPFSNQSSSVLTSLINYAIKCGVKIENEVLVEYINYLDGEFVLNTENKIYKCDKVVLATGSKAVPKTGSDGMGYNFLKKFNHNIIKPLPSLVQLIGKGLYFRKWAGIRTDVIVSLYENDKFIKSEEGEIQLTDYGVSGICIFQLSGIIARGLDNQFKETIKINFIPWLKDNFYDYMDSRNEKLQGFTIEELLEGMFNYKLVNLILELCNISKDLYWNELDDDMKKELYKYLTNFSLDIIGTNGFDKCQVCSGGVDIKEINLNTMESKKQKGLYITGELLDVDGDCGGYNLAIAWITGMLAGSHIND